VNFVISQYILPTVNFIIALVCISQLQDSINIIALIVNGIIVWAFMSLINYIRFNEKAELFIAKEEAQAKTE
jgi:positive regulator of sigma E activity